MYDESTESDDLQYKSRGLERRVAPNLRKAHDLGIGGVEALGARGARIDGHCKAEQHHQEDEHERDDWRPLGLGFGVCRVCRVAWLYGYMAIWLYGCMVLWLYDYEVIY